ncbi:hypothetical protein EV421DRAFT_191760 [Armillaria borealis]|uniref:Major facilitator superfamily (MFS) profile domain-containing protein n=1 Tax=Armillaria borealis TaxID=47425 RepID=A0AA39MUM9_9AGAR|nr:hypothetical protein EV421DRAFT_191760 [Armillaria borealis]
MALNGWIRSHSCSSMINVFILPESLRILLRRGDVPAADNILRKIEADAMASDEDVPAEHGHYRGHGLHAAVHVRETGSVSESINCELRITGIPAALWFQYNDVLLIYLVRIHLIQPATSVGLIISGTAFLFAVALFRAERVSRRRILVFTHLAMIFGTFASISFYCQYCSIFPDPVLGYPVDHTIHTCGELTDGTSYSTTWFAVVLLSIILAAFYSTGLGNIPSQ